MPSVAKHTKLLAYLPNSSLFDSSVMVGDGYVDRAAVRYLCRSRISSIFSAVRFSKYTWSTIIIGALLHAARHSSSRFRKKRPSGVLSPTLMPRRFSTCDNISSPPHNMQEMLVQTEML